MYLYKVEDEQLCFLSCILGTTDIKGCPPSFLPHHRQDNPWAYTTTVLLLIS
jgi:hypothetical protein